MKKRLSFCILFILIWVNGISNVAAATFAIQDIKISSDTLEPENLDEVIFINPHEYPRFPGCEGLDISLAEKKKCAEEKMQKFIYENLKIPEIAQESRIEGMIVISFTVDKEGNIVNPKILRDFGGGFGREGLRVIELMPQWVPGKFNGVPVDLQMNIPIRISLY